MLYRFPPLPADARDPSFLAGQTETFAKLKIESKAGNRTVLMTAHTLIFVMKGIKLLHVGTETVKAFPGSVVLLRKGIYVMAEYIEEGLDFEALMLFLPDKTLRTFEGEGMLQKRKDGRYDHCVVFPVTDLIAEFRNGFRKYFESTPRNFEVLLPLKQKEILLLLMAGVHSDKVNDFICSAISTEEADIDYIVNTYLLRPVSVAELADLANCSLAKFKRDFQQRYGTSPRAWINSRRLEHAAMLLQNTSRTVGEVADECGFESTSHFIRLFRKEYGCTPGEQRAKLTIH
jgi:AraC-like DNA-binding protein